MARIEQRGPKRYRVRYWADGAEHSETFRKKSEAKDFAERVEADKSRDLWHDPRKGRIPLADVWDDYRREAETTGRPAATTLAKWTSTWRAHVFPALGRRQIARIRRLDVKQLRENVLAKSSAYQANEALRLVHLLLARAVDAEDIPFNRAARVRHVKVDRKRPRVLTPGELDRLADAIGPEWRALIYLDGYAALRWSELVAVEVEQIDFLRRTLRVDRRINEVNGRLVPVRETKTGAKGTRTIALPAIVVAELSAHLKRAGIKSGLVFRAAKGGAVRRHNFRKRVWLPAVARAGLDGFTARHLRHTGASLVLEAGGTLKDVSERLGHTTTRMADELYVELYQERGRAIADRMNEMITKQDADPAQTRPGA